MPDDGPRIDLFDSVMARIAAPMKETIAAPMRETLRQARQRSTPLVPCPKCRATLAVFVSTDGCLYHWDDDKLGAPLSLDRKAEVAVRCDPCRTTWRTSGRGVGRALHNGRPPL